MAINLSNIAKGALGGAASGAGIGSAFAGLGTLPGAIGGGILGAGAGLFDQFSGGNNPEQGSFLTGRPQGVQTVGNYNPRQNEIMDMLLGLGQKGLQNPYEGFEPIANYARKNFQENTIPTLAEAFSASGSNASSSPSFQTALGRQAAEFEPQLAALQAQYGMQNRGQSAQLLGMGLTPRETQYPVAAQQGLLHQALPALGQLAAQPGFMELLKSLFSGQGQTSQGQQDQGISPQIVALLQMLLGGQQTQPQG